ncbi:MAG: cysteine desulfurase [Lachnospiraceae bacterium]|nr:cysteine desulfurase [Lachnospiraceae bacterium]
MIYLDNAATTQIEETALDAMLPFLKGEYGNASAVYELARNSKRAVFNARKQCAALIGAAPNEVFFTSGGTESDNHALIGAYEAWKKKAQAGDFSPFREDSHGTANGSHGCCGHIITTAIEHHAVLRTAEYLESQGVSVTFLKPDEEGFISVSQVLEAIKEDTFLVSVMTANNEIGTIEPVCEIADAVHAVRNDILVHTDAVQAYGQIKLDEFAKHVDLLSASSHKLSGPKGCGLLYIRDGVKLGPLIRGGMQESGRRAGTENVPGIVGFGAAAEAAFAGLDAKMTAECTLRDRLLAKIGIITDVIINGAYESGDFSKRLPGNISVCIKGIEGESALIMLDRAGICASSGSACTSGAREPSHVLKAIGRADDEAKGSLRFTLSHHNTEEEIDKAAEVLSEIVDKLRNGKKHL